MSTIVTRAAKGSPLTHTEVDANFTNLNTDKIESGNTVASLIITSADINGGSIDGTTIGGSTPAAGTFTTLTATGNTLLGGDSSNPSLKVNAIAGVTRWIEADGSVSGNPRLFSWSTGSAAGMVFTTRGASNFSFTTNTSSTNEQFRVAHTASAVNYVQVTGAATGGFPVIFSQGSDTNLSLGFYSKGTGGFSFRTGGGLNRAFEIVDVASAVNRAQVKGSATGTAPEFFVEGSDTNIDLTLTPKGTGLVRFGTHTATALTISGYIEIKDSGGTTRKLAVVT